ncbi:MAG: hydrogenase maturation nickel metallochaperone HypA [Bacteroidales bacterium]|jgi:hydrogenase nickel incorporation protein HypA/HybF|nr:hydrogenase maturation nickel metallochaperone HypA [Bacteroidales bacterium]
MHEFSIAVSIIEIAEAEAQKAHAVKIKELILDIGTMSGVEFYALDTALEMAVKNTMLENSKLKINKIQAKAKCAECAKEFEINQVYDPCPFCNSLYHELLSGKELQIKSIVVDVED